MADLGPGFGAVRLPARAAPWLSAGLKVLLRPEGWQERQAAADAAQAAVESAVLAERREQARPASPPASRAIQARPAPPPLAPPPAPAVPTDWPQPWAGFLARVARPSRALFTYWELGADMAGVATGEQTDSRRALFQEIVKQLREKAGWPKGAAGFWPIAACESDGGLCAHTDLFLRGVAELKPRMVCVFGEKALRALDPLGGGGGGGAYRHGPRKIQGINCLILPGPEEMLPDNREAKRIVWNWLKAQDI